MDVNKNRLEGGKAMSDADKLEEAMRMRKDGVRLLLSSIGEDVDREGLLDTPDRVARMYNEIFAGYGQDPREILKTTFEADSDDLVLVRDIKFWSHCEHHIVPFFGVAHIAYIPNRTKRVVGLSKIVRLVDVFARRLQIQERLTTQIADALDECLQPYGIAVIIQAEHMCMTMRGINRPGATTITSHMRGIFKEEEKARNELLQLLKL